MFIISNTTNITIIIIITIITINIIIIIFYYLQIFGVNNCLGWEKRP